jgi:hypothetical protein
VAAAAAASLGRVAPVRADNGDFLVIGFHNTATQGTSLGNDADDGGITFDAVGHGSTGGSVGESGSGIAVEAASESGVGPRVSKGRIRADEVSGVATIAAGARSKTVNPGVDINARTFVPLTPMDDVGERSLWFRKNVNTDTFTIRMSATRGRATRVAWLALERGLASDQPT